MITRSEDGVLAGVCAGFGKEFDLEPWLVRFVAVCSVLIFGTGLFFYLMLAIAIPREDKAYRAYEHRLLGVCSSISRRGDLDIGLVRFFALILLFASFGWAIIFYVIAYFVLPNEAKITEPAAKRPRLSEEDAESNPMEEEPQ